MAKEIVVNLKATAKVENREQINELRRSLKKAQEDVDLYKSKWEETLNEISELQERLEGVKNVSGIKVLEQELETFRETAQRSQREFTTFLKSVNLNTMEFRSLDAVQEMIDNLGKGLITVNQAVAQVKSSFGYLMEDSYKNGSGAFNADIVKTFATTLDGLTKSMDVVLQKLSQFETDGVKAAGGGGGGGLGNIAETFKQIAVGAEALSERASGSLNAISELVSAINSYANVDSAKLLAVSNAFGNIAAIGGHNFSENSVKNIINLATELSALNRNGDFNFRFDLTGINGVTISKTIRYLTEYLPGLSNNTNFDNLAKISSISFANLSSENLKVSKATIANLMELIQTMSGNASKKDAFSQYDYGAGQAAQTVTQELQQASVAVKDAGSAVRDNLGSMPQQAKTAEAAITGYADKVEAEMQRISKAIEKSYNLDALTAKLKRGDLDIIRQALQTGVGGGDPFAALETLAGSKTQLARTSDYIKTGLGNPVLMELNNVREQYETFIKYIDNDYSDLYNKFNALALLFKGFSGGKDNLQISGRDLYGKIDTSKVPFASFDAFQASLNGISANFPNLANYSSTLGLDTLNLKGVEDQSERIRAAAELAVAAKREEATAVAGVSEALASGSQSAADHSRVMEQNVAATKAVVAASKEEKAAFSDGNQAKKEDAAAAEAAAKAEEEKRKISELLAEALKREEEATNGTSSSAAKHTDVIKQQEDAMWEAYRAEQGMHNKSTAETEAEVDREIAAYNKRLDAQQAAADKAQKAWEKEEAAAMAAADKKAEAEERAAQRKIKAAEDAAAKAAAAEQKAAEAAIKRTAYDDAKRAVNQYYDLLSDQNKDPSKRADVVMTDAGWASKSGLYAGFAQQLNDATAAFNMLTDAQNKNNLSGQQVAAINELIATRQKEYALAVENTAAKEAEHAQKSEELTQKKQAEAEAARAAKEAKQQEAEATKAQAQAERDAAKAAKETEQNANRKKNYITQLNSLLVKCEGAERKYAAASKISNARDNYEGIQRTKEEVQKLLVELEKESPDLDRVAAGLRNCTTEYSKNSAALQTNNSLVGRWVTNGMQQLTSRLQYSVGLAAMVYKAVGEVKKMVSTAVELDSAMNTLQIVTRASGAEMDEYGKRVSSMAKETAQATKDLIDATTVYARLGYSMDESAILSKYTAMLEGVGIYIA